MPRARACHVGLGARARVYNFPPRTTSNHFPLINLMRIKPCTNLFMHTTSFLPSTIIHDSPLLVTEARSKAQRHSATQPHNNPPPAKHHSRVINSYNTKPRLRKPTNSPVQRTETNSRSLFQLRNGEPSRRRQPLPHSDPHVSLRSPPHTARALHHFPYLIACNARGSPFLG